MGQAMRDIAGGFRLAQRRQVEPAPDPAAQGQAGRMLDPRPKSGLTGQQQRHRAAPVTVNVGQLPQLVQFLDAQRLGLVGNQHDAAAPRPAGLDEAAQPGQQLGRGGIRMILPEGTQGPAKRRGQLRPFLTQQAEFDPVPVAMDQRPQEQRLAGADIAGQNRDRLVRFDRGYQHRQRPAMACGFVEQRGIRQRAKGRKDRIGRHPVHETGPAGKKTLGSDVSRQPRADPARCLSPDRS